MAGTELARTEPSRVRSGNLWLGILGLLTGGMAWLTHAYVLEGIPHVQDEIAYLWQAQVFAAGQLTVPIGDSAPFTALAFIQHEGGQAASIFPPGWSWILALFHTLGAMQIAPMLLATLLPLALWRLAGALVEDLESLTPWMRRAIPMLAATLVPMSLGVVTMAGTYMAHTWSLLLYLLFVTAALRLGRGGGISHALMAGASLGLLSATRPLDALAGGLPVLIWVGWRWLDGHIPSSRIVAAGVAGGIFLALLGAHNKEMTGSPIKFAQDTYFSKLPIWMTADVYERTFQEEDFRVSPTCNALGIGEERGCHTTYGTLGHTPEKAVRNGLENLRAFDRNLFGGVGGLLLVVPGLWLLRKRLSLLMISAVMLVVGYSLYWYHGICYGARFLHPVHGLALVASAAVVAWGAELLHQRLRLGTPIIWTALLLGVLGVRGAPYQAALLRELNSTYWCVNDRVSQMVHEIAAPSSGQKMLILMGFTDHYPGYYPLSSVDAGGARCNYILRSNSGLLHNDPWLRNEWVYVRMPQDPAHFRTVLKEYSDRRVVLYLYRTNEHTEELLELSNGEFRSLIKRRDPSPR